MFTLCLTRVRTRDGPQLRVPVHVNREQGKAMTFDVYGEGGVPRICNTRWRD